MRKLHVKKTENGNTVEYTLTDDKEIDTEIAGFNFDKVFDEMFQERKKMFEGFFGDLVDRLFPLKTLENPEDKKELSTNSSVGRALS